MLNAILDHLLKEFKFRALRTELHILAVFFGVIALLFFIAGGWSFLVEIRGKVFASLVVGGAFLVLSVFIMLLTALKSKSHAQQDINLFGTDQQAANELVVAFLKGIDAGKRRKKE